MTIPAFPPALEPVHPDFPAGGTPTVQGAMNSYSGKAGQICNILKSLGLSGGSRLVRDTLFSVNHYYMLGRSLNTPIEYPFFRKPDLSFLKVDDVTIDLMKEQVKSLPPDDRREMLGRLHFHTCGFSNCYVMKAGEEIAYVQWIIFPQENDVIASRFSSKFYPLSEKQIMVENVFTFPRFRGRGLLPFGTLQLLELARSRGYASAICYIRKENITSLNEFSKMGFKIMKLLKEYKVFGRVWRTL